MAALYKRRDTESIRRVVRCFLLCPLSQGHHDQRAVAPADISGAFGVPAWATACRAPWGSSL